jgi:phosphatidylinositol alpha-mannosyltransferase
VRICLVTPYDLAEEGGVKRHVIQLAAHLRQAGDDVAVIGPLSEGGAEDGVHGFSGVVNIPANGAANRIALLTPPGTVRRFFAERRFDVVHFHEPHVPLLTYYAAYYAAWLTPAAAHVATFHMYAEREGSTWRTLRRFVGLALLPTLRRGIAVSQAAAEYAGRAWPGPLAVIPNGVPTATFRPAAESVRAAQAPVRLLFVGSWRDERKGLRLLLDAHQRLRGEGLDLTLDVVGIGPAGAPPPSLPGVAFRGVVPTEEGLAESYRSADVFVSPATGQESFGIVLLEAMASGLPIVCSDIAGYREVAPPEGARLSRPGDAGALAEAIRKVVAAGPEARRRMGAVNRQAAESYDWTMVARRVRMEYEAALLEAVPPQWGRPAARPEPVA